MTEKKESFLDQLTTFQKIVATAITIVGSLWLAGWGAIEAIDEKARQRDEEKVREISEIVAQILNDQGLVTSSEFTTISDSLATQIDQFTEANERMHLRTLKRQDTILLALEGNEHRDAELKVKIKAIEAVLKKIQGITTTSLEEQRDYALTDSLQNELIRLKQDRYNRERMRQMEEMHKQELREIREAAKDDGETKVIKVKPGKSKKRKTFKDRILVPL